MLTSVETKSTQPTVSTPLTGNTEVRELENLQNGLWMFFPMWIILVGMAYFIPYTAQTGNESIAVAVWLGWHSLLFLGFTFTSVQRFRHKGKTAFNLKFAVLDLQFLWFSALLTGLVLGAICLYTQKLTPGIVFMIPPGIHFIIGVIMKHAEVEPYYTKEFCDMMGNV